ncbi:hypothetical protein AX15_003440 [Amanita polypyramis BW_CC]|nr:hypothetical protein AX15_003440 [Amanita polypyramis BW_CC]
MSMLDETECEFRLDSLPYRHPCPQAYRPPPPRTRKDSNKTQLDCVPEGKVPFMEDVVADNEWMWDKGLRRRGLHRGPYYRFLALYSLTPLTALVTFLFLAILPSFAYPLESDQWKERHPPYLPFPLPELLVSIAFSSLSHLLRAPIFFPTSFLSSLSILENFPYGTYGVAFSILLSCAFYTASTLLLRVYSFAVFLPIIGFNSILSNSAISTTNPVFRIVWWTALGWAIAGATMGITQGYQAINLYKDVLVSTYNKSHDLNTSKDDNAPCLERNEDGKGKQVALPRDHVSLSRREPTCYGTLATSDQGCEASSSTNIPTLGERDRLLREGSDLSVITSSSFASLSPRPSVTRVSPVEDEDIEAEESELQVQLDRDIDHLMAFRKREELEELYGIPFIKIPIFVSCLHRVNALLQSLSFSLLLTAAYIRASSTRSNLTVVPVSFISDALSPQPVRILTTSVFLLDLFLTLLHTPILLPKLGVHTVVYVSFIIALGTLFVGLAVWGGVA